MQGRYQIFVSVGQVISDASCATSLHVHTPGTSLRPSLVDADADTDDRDVESGAHIVPSADLKAVLSTLPVPYRLLPQLSRRRPLRPRTSGPWTQ